MRIHILSDLHVDYAALTLPRIEADVTVVAGDVCPRKCALAWIHENCQGRQVVYVLGNHESYGGAVPKTIEDLRRMSEGSNIHILENDHLNIDGIRFLGCTLWTDFRLFGDPMVAGREAEMVMNDYRRIRVSPQFRRLKGRDTASRHLNSLRWLRAQLDLQISPTVIVTHHAPSARSLKPEESNDLISAAYASNLDGIVSASRVPLWIHGHIHRRVDYLIGETRIISNPRGYARAGESRSFEPAFVIDL